MRLRNYHPELFPAYTLKERCADLISSLVDRAKYAWAIVRPSTRDHLTAASYHITEAIEIMSHLPGGERHDMPFGEEMDMERSITELREELESARDAIPQTLVSKVTC